MIYNDLTRQRGLLVAVFIPVSSSAFLLAFGVLVIERSSSSTTQLFETAKPPDFLQMHYGDYDRAALQSFADEHPEITSWQIHEMMGFDGHHIGWHRPGTSDGGEFSESLVDNLFVPQNTSFDFLIDANNAVVQPEPGSVYVPVAYEQHYGLQVGDRLTRSRSFNAHTSPPTSCLPMDKPSQRS